jgi:regulatory protein
VTRRVGDGERPSAKQKALGLLARREHSAREIEQKLVAKGYAKQDAGGAVDSLKSAGHQSDGRYAENLIRARVTAGYGPRYIEAELRSHGIDPRTLAAELAAHDWNALAANQVRRQYGALTRDPKERNRAVQFLARRGFSIDAIRAATRIPAAKGDD